MSPVVSPAPFLFGLLLAATVLGGCFTADKVGPVAEPDRSGPDTTVVQMATDPQGDAVLYRDFLFSANHCNAVVAAAGARETCRAVTGEVVPYVPREAGVPAPDALDLLGFAFQETVDDLVVSIQLASLDPTWEGFTSPEERTYGYVWVCWYVNGDLEYGEECTFLSATYEQDKLVLESYYDRYDPGCNDWWWCTWHVDWKIEYGSPATVHLTIPRTIMNVSASGEELIRPTAGTYRWDQPPHRVTWQVSAPPFGYRMNPIYYGAWHFADTTQEADPFTFQTTALPVHVEMDSVRIFEDGADGAAAKIVEELAFEIVETPTHITLATQVALVEETMQDHMHFVAFGADSPRIHMAWYDIIGGEMSIGAGFCPDPECARWVSYPVDYTFEPGTPGWINVTFARSDLEMPRRGALVHQLWSAMSLPREETTATVGPATFTIWKDILPKGDWTPPSPPYWLHYDSMIPVESDDGAAVTEDARGDVAAQNLATMGEPNRDLFDIRYYEIEGLDERTTRVTLGISDLSKVEVPDKNYYDAIFFAVGVETVAGRWMVGYHENADGVGQFLCAPDTSVLVPPADIHDPADVVWTAIRGIMAPARDAPRGAGTQGEAIGSIILDVPHECLGEVAGTTFVSSATGAATFLITNDNARRIGIERAVNVMDSVMNAAPVTFGKDHPTESQVRPRALHVLGLEVPFDDTNFWDILGIVTVLGGSVLGLVLVQRRRSRLRVFLRQIQETRTAHPRSPKARRAALAAIHDSAKGALIKGRLSEGHFVIVDQHVREAKR